MNHEFWHERWKNNEIGFHEGTPNELLASNFNSLKSVLAGNRIFVPLCGKTIDIHWLIKQGFYVVGVELSEIAIEDLFKSLNITPEINNMDQISHYKGPNIEVFVTDIFNLNSKIIGNINGTYDRAALVALPKNIRTMYAQHLKAITNNAPQLLITFDYNQEISNGPPFSIPESEINRLYSSNYTISLLESRHTTINSNGTHESIYLLTQ
jgi:thiopurine S-methyltransferase